jgi:cell division transport system permease protein
MLLRRAIRNALTGLLRHRGLSLATTLVVSLTFGATSGFALFAYGAEKIIGYYESRPLVTAFFLDEATEEEVLTLRDDLLSWQEVTEVTYISKEQAFSIYSEQFQDQPELLESIPTNILPASLDVRTKSLDDLPKVAEFFEGSELVEEVSFYQDVIERFRNLVTVARYGLLGLMGVFAFISIVIVLSTIGLIIYSMEEEIGIMSLLGASSSYIRLPFLFQGAIYGILAALLSGGLLALAIPFVLPYFRSFFPNVTIVDPSITFQLKLLGVEIASGALLGSFGSWLAVNRYLRF